jgi:ABC-type transport system substrate-binding protein
MPLDAMSDVQPYINLPFNPLKDIRVRRAISHAIDTRHYIDYILYGRANLITIPAPRTARYFPSHLEYYKFDLDLATRLMAEAGLSNGFEMTLYSTRGTYSLRLSDFIRESLSKININVNIVYHDGAEIFQKLQQNTPSAFIQIGSSSAPLNDVSQFINILLNYTPSLSQSSNYLKLFNPTISNQIRQLGNVNIEPGEKARLSKELTDTVFEQVMIIPFFQPFIFHTMQRHVTWNHKNNGQPMLREIQVKR